MFENIKKMWVNALRFGGYKQVNGTLKGELDEDEKDNYEGAYCALGVLCKLYEDQHPYGRVNYSSGTLPKNVQKWAGLKEEDPVIGNGSYSTVSELNDYEEESFKQIAKRIEKKL